MSSENPQPYVGITGIPQDKAVALGVNSLIGKNQLSSHRWMTGYLITQTALSEPTIQNSYLHSLRSLHSALEQTHQNGFTTVHYIPKEHTSVPTQVVDLMTRTSIYADGLCDGLQINNYLPQPDELSRIKDSFPKLRLIVQLGPQQFKTPPPDLAESLSSYTGLADYVLLDSSLGKGKMLQVPRVISYATAIQDSLPKTTVVFAGGITPENVIPTVNNLRESMGTTLFGIDAQHGFLTKIGKEHPVFDIDKVRQYTENAQTAFRP